MQVLPPEQVYVATDSKKISDHCANHEIPVIMTSSDCLTGTDRLFEASQQVEADIYINVQGDEPLVEPSDILEVIKASSKNPKWIVNAMCSIKEERDFRSPTVPKVVVGPDGRLLYMSRAAIPTDKQHGFVTAHKQVCIYAFPSSALRAFAAVPHKTPLEAIEDIEILRFLELGFDVHMVEVSSTSIAVDVPGDVVRVEDAIRERTD